MAHLPTPSKLGRLYVFASCGGAYSPYVDYIEVVSDGPRMMTPLSLRLTPHNPRRELKFVSSLNGRIKIMQELDTASELRAKVRLRRKICPHLSWRDWITRLLPW